MKRSTRQLVLSAAFAGLAVAVGYALAQFPNIELVTTIIFLSGYVLGWRNGALIGLVAEGIYSTFSPYGMPPLPVLLAQMLGMCLAGIAGGRLQRILNSGRLQKTRLVLGLAGFSITLFYDLLTTLATAAVLGLGRSSLWGLFAYGGVFYALHLVSNVLIFALLLPVLLRSLPTRRLTGKLNTIENPLTASAPCD